MHPCDINCLKVSGVLGTTSPAEWSVVVTKTLGFFFSFFSRAQHSESRCPLHLQYAQIGPGRNDIPPLCSDCS